jgi:exosome complex component RRP42
LIDAAALAAMTALLNTRVPKIVDEKIVRKEFERRLPVEHQPVTVSVCKLGNKYILDPLLEEENVLDAKLSIAVMEDDRICALQKQGNKGLEFDEIETMIDLAMEKSKQIRKLIS